MDRNISGYMFSITLLTFNIFPGAKTAATIISSQDLVCDCNHRAGRHYSTLPRQAHGFTKKKNEEEGFFEV